MVETPIDCKKCGLSVGRKNIVNGCGNPNSRIVFIGEAPGANEDSTGTPFVGRAGRFLESVLKSAKTDRVEVFITNVVRCRPPGNRKPTNEEMDACLSYLTSEIEAIRPKIVVALGATPVGSLIDFHGKLGDVVGKEFPLRVGEVQTLLIPCYHPSAAMRSGTMRVKFKETIAAAVEKAVP